MVVIIQIFLQCIRKENWNNLLDAILRSRRRASPLPLEKSWAYAQPHKDHLTSKLKYRRFPSYLLCTLILFPFHLFPTGFFFYFFPGFLAIFTLLSSNTIFPLHLVPSPVHPTGFSFCFFPGFLAIFTLLSPNNNNNQKLSPFLELDFHRS